MTRTQFDVQIDGAILAIAKLTGLSAAHTQPTKAMRDTGQPAGDRDALTGALGKAIRRSLPALIAAAATAEDPEGREFTPDDVRAVLAEALAAAAV